MTKKVWKAVILARGLGTRMRAASNNDELNYEQKAIAEAGVKTLLPIVGQKTLLDFIFESLTAAGFRKFCLVIGEEHQIIRDFCAKKDLDIEFAVQDKPRGTADAVLSAEKFVGNDFFLTVNGDNLYPVNSLKLLREMGETGLIAFEQKSLIEKSNIPTERSAKFALVELDDEDFLQRIVEKPSLVTPDSCISMNAWLFSPEIFEACRIVKPSPRGELEITDAVTFLLENSAEKFKAVRSREGVLDLSHRTDIKNAAALLKKTR